MIFTQTIDSLIGGVSQFPDQLRASNEVTEATNMYAIPEQNVVARRPGTTSRAQLGTADLSNAFFHVVSRTSSEQYVAVVNAGGLKVYSLQTGAELPVTMAPGSTNYLTTSSNRFRAATVGDYTFLVNPEKVVRRKEGSVSPVQELEGLIWVRDVDYSCDYSVTLGGFGLSDPAQTVTITTPDETGPGAKGSLSTDRVAQDLLEALQFRFQSVDPSDYFEYTKVYEFTRYGSVIHVKSVGVNAVPIKIVTSDGLGDNGLQAIVRQVQKVQDLPSRGRPGMLLKVANDPGTGKDDFWVRYEEETGGTQNGIWRETVAPGEPIEMDSATMPHALIRTGKVAPSLPNYVPDGCPTVTGGAFTRGSVPIPKAGYYVERSDGVVDATIPATKDVKVLQHGDYAQTEVTMAFPGDQRIAVTLNYDMDVRSVADPYESVTMKFTTTFFGGGYSFTYEDTAVYSPGFYGTGLQFKKELKIPSFVVSGAATINVKAEMLYASGTTPAVRAVGTFYGTTGAGVIREWFDNYLLFTVDVSENYPPYSQVKYEIDGDLPTGIISVDTAGTPRDGLWVRDRIAEQLQSIGLSVVVTGGGSIHTIRAGYPTMMTGTLLLGTNAGIPDLGDATHCIISSPTRPPSAGQITLSNGQAGQQTRDYVISGEGSGQYTLTLTPAVSVPGDHVSGDPWVIFTDYNLQYLLTVAPEFSYNQNVFYNPGLSLVGSPVGNTIQNSKSGGTGIITAGGTTWVLAGGGLINGGYPGILRGDTGTVFGAGDSYFTFGPVDWVKRLAGNLDNSKFPSFMDQQIREVFFYRNRLGFTSNDNVIMSASNDLFRFTRKTVTDLLDDDPIDVRSAHQHIATFDAAAAWGTYMVLFSGTGQQFYIAGDPTLTPKTARLEHLGSYGYDPLVRPQVVGQRLYFPSSRLVDASRFIQVSEMYLSPSSGDVVSDDLTQKVPKYIAGNMKALAGDGTTGFLAVLADGRYARASINQETVYACRTVFNGGQRVLSSWSAWTFINKVQFMTILNGIMYLVVQRPQGAFLETINLSGVVSNAAPVYSDRQGWAAPASLPTASCRIILSRLYLRGQDGKSITNGRLAVNRVRLKLNDAVTCDASLIHYGGVTRTYNIANYGRAAADGRWLYVPVFTNADAYSEFLISSGASSGFTLSTVEWEGNIVQRSRSM